MSVMSERSELVQDLMKALGLPKSTKWFVLSCRVGELVSIECEYYPEERTDLDTISKKYHLALEEIKENEETSS